MSSDGFAKDSELVLGLVAPVGARLDGVTEILKERLEHFRYTATRIRLSHLLRELDLGAKLVEEPVAARYRAYMDAGDEARRRTQQRGVLALSAAYEILKVRMDSVGTKGPMPRRASILHSLKHPEEVLALRRIYGPAFFLIGVHAPRAVRQSYLVKDRNVPEDEARALIERDEGAPEEWGQRTRDTFELADAFVSLHDRDYKERLWRILDLLFGDPFSTPTRDEHAMFMAYGASLRSGDLSRQVGAVILSRGHEVIATGANDVPRSGGGLYWADDGDGDQRDHRRGFDSNERERDSMARRVLAEFEGGAERDLRPSDRAKLERTGLLDITEYGRAVHAEMEALLACARSGVSPRRGTLYSTTFPCHNCAKHIVAAGIRRVVYIEPYPKSRALDLHDDSITLEAECGGRVRFEPFVGVGPRRFLDLFSTRLGTGRKVKRKAAGSKAEWTRDGAELRVPLPTQSYLEREALATDELHEKLKAAALLKATRQGET